MEDVPCVTDRHILRWVLLWSGRDHSCFYVPYGTRVHWKCDWVGRNCVIMMH